jgi:hypothetical protein
MLHLMLGERHGGYPARPRQLAPGASVPLANSCGL